MLQESSYYRRLTDKSINKTLIEELMDRIGNKIEERSKMGSYQLSFDNRYDEFSTMFGLSYLDSDIRDMIIEAVIYQLYKLGFTVDYRDTKIMETKMNEIDLMIMVI